VSWETLLTCSKRRIIWAICAIRSAGNIDFGIKALYFASMSLHSMPRGAEPFGASTVLVKRAPDLVTIVTVAPHGH